MNALEVLKQDHQKVKGLFKEATGSLDRKNSEKNSSIKLIRNWRFTRTSKRLSFTQR